MEQGASALDPTPGLVRQPHSCLRRSRHSPVNNGPRMEKSYHLRSQRAIRRTDVAPSLETMQMDGRRGLVVLVGLLASISSCRSSTSSGCPFPWTSFRGRPLFRPVRKSGAVQGLWPVQDGAGILPPTSSVLSRGRHVATDYGRQAGDGIAQYGRARGRGGSSGAAVSRGAVLGGLLLTVVMSTFLERSSELRVDMMTSWIGLPPSSATQWPRRLGGHGSRAELLDLTEGPLLLPRWSVTLAALWFRSGGSSRGARQLLRFCSASLTVVGLYVGFWALWGGLERVGWPPFGARAYRASESLRR